jgi:hypothetical protein
MSAAHGQHVGLLLVRTGHAAHNLALLRRIARTLGVPVVLGALPMNRATDLYRRLGFRENGRSATHTGFEWRPETGAGTTPAS